MNKIAKEGLEVAMKASELGSTLESRTLVLMAEEIDRLEAEYQKLITMLTQSKYPIRTDPAPFKQKFPRKVT